MYKISKINNNSSKIYLISAKKEKIMQLSIIMQQSSLAFAGNVHELQKNLTIHNQETGFN